MEATRGEWILWTDSSMWRLEGTNGVLTAWEDPRPIMAAAIAQLNGRRLRSVEIAPLSADTTCTFEGGLVLRLFSTYMDPEGDDAHWMLFVPQDRVLVLGPSTRWAVTDRTHVWGRGLKRDTAIIRFETQCADAWPCTIATFTLQTAQNGGVDRLDLRLELLPSNHDDRRLITLGFQGVQHL